jgi:hypothetical protein
MYKNINNLRAKQNGGAGRREIQNVERSQNVIENKGQEKAVFAYPRMFMKTKVVVPVTLCPKLGISRVLQESVPENAGFCS